MMELLRSPELRDAIQVGFRSDRRAATWGTQSAHSDTLACTGTTGRRTVERNDRLDSINGIAGTVTWGCAASDSAAERGNSMSFLSIDQWIRIV